MIYVNNSHSKCRCQKHMSYVHIMGHRYISTVHASISLFFVFFFCFYWDHTSFFLTTKKSLDFSMTFHDSRNLVQFHGQYHMLHVFQIYGTVWPHNPPGMFSKINGFLLFSHQYHNLMLRCIYTRNTQLFPTILHTQPLIPTARSKHYSQTVTVPCSF